jgi:hypothetical protein
MDTLETYHRSPLRSSPTEPRKPSSLSSLVAADGAEEALAALLSGRRRRRREAPVAVDLGIEVLGEWMARGYSPSYPPS